MAIYTEDDISHTYNADKAIKLADPSSYMNIEELVKVVRDDSVDAVHPGYGFLSESADFAKQLENIGVSVIGPGSEILQRTGDKLQARKLAEECHVPVLPALTNPTSDAQEVKKFAQRSGYPIMIKAVDGGGGRGIRLVEDASSFESNLARAIEESPSRQVFVEKAAINGYRHIEVQIVGDGRGHVTHLWERECSIQRRYQKVVELAPSTISDRKLVASVIEAALTIAMKVPFFTLLIACPLLTLLSDPLSLVRNIRVSGQSRIVRVLLPRDQSETPSGAHSYRINLQLRYCQPAASDCSGSFTIRYRSSSREERPLHASAITINPAPYNSRGSHQELDAKRWQDPILPLPLWQWHPM